MSATILNFESLIGKKLSASGWSYDNGGNAFGIITKIEHKETYNQYEFFVNPSSALSMNSFVFSEKQTQMLLKDGKLPEANKFLNSGTDASITD